MLRYLGALEVKVLDGYRRAFNDDFSQSSASQASGLRLIDQGFGPASGVGGDVLTDVMLPGEQGAQGRGPIIEPMEGGTGVQ